MKPPKEGSRKADVFALMNAKGFEAGLAKGLALGLQESTIRSWAPTWGITPPPKGGGIARPPRKEAQAARPAPEPRAPSEWSPFFKYATRAAAERALDGICKRAGCAPRAYNVLEEDGRYAVAPAHYKPAGPAPTFKVGDYVSSAITPNVVSRVLVTGQLTCTIKGPDDPEDGIVVSSYYLASVSKPTKAAPAKAKPKPKAKAKVDHLEALIGKNKSKGKQPAKPVAKKGKRK